MKEEYWHGYPIAGGGTQQGAYSLRLFVLDREAQDDATQARWAKASKADLIKQVRLAAAGGLFPQDLVHCTAPPLQCNTYADFKYEKTMLQWLAYERGHRVIYGVRFHCECAPVEAMWSYIVSKLRQQVDGKSSTLVVALVEKLAYGIKPDVAARLFFRPTTYQMLYSLAVVSNDELTAGLMAMDVFALMRAFSGYGNKHVTTVAHAKARVGAEGHGGDVADSEADSSGGEEGVSAKPAHRDVDDEDPLAVGDLYAPAPPRGQGHGGGRGSASSPSDSGPESAGGATTLGRGGRRRVRRLPGGALAAPAEAASASAVAAQAHPVAVPDSALAKCPVPDEVPRNLWELLSCVMHVGRRRKTDVRRANPTHYGAFVAAAQRAWDSRVGRAVLELLAGKVVSDMTPAFALQHSVVLSLEVACTLPYHEEPE